MDPQEARWEVNATLIKRGFVYAGPGPDCYTGQIKVGHKSTEVRIEIPDLDFITLPRIVFVDKLSLPSTLLAHIEQGFGLCYADGTLIRLDRFQPGASILRVLEEAEKTIHRSLSGRGSIEIALEYPLYWKGANVQILLSRQERVEKAHFALPGEGVNTSILLVGEKQRIPNGYRTGRKARIFYMSGNLVPAHDFVAPQTLGELEVWKTYQTIGNSVTFESMILSLANKEVIFFSAENGWVGCQLCLPQDLETLVNANRIRPDFLKKQLWRRRGEIRLTHYCGKEASLDYVTTRNLRNKAFSLKNKKIALVGCGTIGSHLARFLTQSGAGNGQSFFIIDNQELAPGNLGRHLLNFSNIGQLKATALADELRRFHPEVLITPIVDDIKQVWSRVVDCDLIIDATGVESVGDFLNTQALKVRKKNLTCNLLHVWLFGNGIAAQSFLNVGEGFGCYRCLRPNLDEPWLSDPRKDVKSVGSISPASCGEGPYLPFTVDAPVLAASLASRATLDFFAGSTGARLRNHAINVDQAQKLNDKSPRPHKSCPACGVD